MIGVVIDDNELKKLISETTTADRAAVIVAKQTVKAASFALEKRIKKEMPVDTGRARASWGHGTDSIWIESEGGLAIEQGSNVEYIVYLNRGHSKQAPAGFIDQAFVVAEFELMNALGLFDPLSPDAQGVQLPLFGG